MSYDYSSESQRLELPNPHKIENLFLFLSGGIFFVIGIVSLLLAKNHLANGKGLATFIPLIASIVLLILSIRYAAKAMTQLRFFFGRGLPVGLTAELPPDHVGKMPGIDVIKEDIRRGALHFDEPKGPLNGLLYDRIPQLIVAPKPLQALAQAQFRNGLVIALTLVSLMIAWLGFGESKSAQWIGLFYFGFATWLVLQPMSKDSLNKAHVGESGVITLIIVAIIGPIAVGYISSALPDLSWMSLHWQALFLLLSALASVALFFMALLRQLTTPPSTNMSCEQLTLNMNTHPAQIIGEFDRVMQQKWVDKIPNRRYERIEPEVDAEAKTGTFSGEVVEETQPMPSSNLQSLTLSGALDSERTRWLVYLNAVGTTLLALSAILVGIFVWRFDPLAIDKSKFSLMTSAFVALAVGRYCFNACAELWGRFDFVSEVVWIEISGQYTTARNRLGNDFSSTVRTESHAISIDSMTMRVWTARIESVVFEKKDQRLITAMNGQSEITKGLATHLADFAGARSMFVAPSNQEDLKKIAAVQTIEQMQPSSTALTPQALLPQQQVEARPASESKFCADCGAGRAALAKFCLECGTKFA
jgi:hypothetical protein